MRNGHFSVTILVDGVEHAGQADGIVPVAFGHEYSIRLRTHNGRRAVARLQIDGVDITDGGLIIPSYGYVDLETPPAKPGSRFRFASVDSPAAHAAGKDNIGAAGVIRVEFQSERYVPPVALLPISAPLGPSDFEKYYSSGELSSKGFTDVGAESCGVSSTHNLSSGVTVGGSASSQSFHTQHIDTDGVTTVVTLKLKGFTSREYSHAYVSTAINYCTYCGQPADRLSNICRCGHRLR